MPNAKNTPDPIFAKEKIEEALSVLKDLGLPQEQQNERSALSLLALLDMGPDTFWADASSPLRGITQMMDFFTEHYGKKYAPNTRETVRRFTIHQFVQAGLVVIQKKLDNENFLKRAPADVVADEREKQAAYQDRLNKLRENYGALA